MVRGMELSFSRLFVILLLLFSCAQASAEGDLYLLAGGFSKHFDDRANGQDHNEVHNNIGLEYEHHFKDGLYWGLAGQYMENSLDNDSFLFTFNGKKKWKINKDSNVGIGFMAGAQNGYPKKSEGRDDSEFVPVAYPIVEYNYQRVGAYATCVPEVYDSGFCFVGFKVRLTPWDWY